MSTIPSEIKLLSCPYCGSAPTCTVYLRCVQPGTLKYCKGCAVRIECPNCEGEDLHIRGREFNNSDMQIALTEATAEWEAKNKPRIPYMIHVEIKP